MKRLRRYNPFLIFCEASRVCVKYVSRDIYEAEGLDQRAIIFN